MKKILIVDDDVEYCEGLSEILQDEGFAVETVFEGCGGKEKIEKNDYDLVILDFKMFGLNGIEILKDMKKKKHNHKFFIISGKFQIEHSLKEEQLFNFVAGVMQKPFEVEELLAKIRACLS